MATTGLQIFTNRTNESISSPILDVNNGEVLMHSLPNVSIVLASRPAESPGTLYITSRQVIWLSDVDVNKGYAVDFFSITLHAISRDPEGYPSPCIYTQIETGDDDSEEEDEAEQQTGDLSKIKEMRLVPSDPSQLETLFNMFCECAELNPEPNMEAEDQEGHNWIFSADQLTGDTFGNGEEFANSIGHSNGDHDLARNVLQLQINDQRFEDAEEMEDDTNSSPQ